MAQLLIPTPLRAFTERKSEVELNGATVGEIIDALTKEYPDIKAHLFDEDGSLRSYINVYVGESNIRDLNGLQTTVSNDTTVMLVPAIAGGWGN